MSASIVWNGIGSGPAGAPCVCLHMFLTRRLFDAWGNVRIGSTSGNPTGRYCANIGHRQDDESGLVYMRARYYEPTSGRFITSDVKRFGPNWYAYCRNVPTCFSDESGMSENPIKQGCAWGFMAIGFAFNCLAICFFTGYDPAEIAFGYAASTIGACFITLSLLANDDWTLDSIKSNGLSLAIGQTVSLIMQKCQMMYAAAEAYAGMKTYAAIAVASTFVYTVLICSYLAFETLAVDW